MKATTFNVLLLFYLSIATGCGNKSSLYLPTDADEKKADAPEAVNAPLPSNGSTVMFRPN